MSFERRESISPLHNHGFGIHHLHIPRLLQSVRLTLPFSILFAVVLRFQTQVQPGDDVLCSIYVQRGSTCPLITKLRAWTRTAFHFSCNFFSPLTTVRRCAAKVQHMGTPSSVVRRCRLTANATPRIDTNRGSLSQPRATLDAAKAQFAQMFHMPQEQEVVKPVRDALRGISHTLLHADY